MKSARLVTLVIGALAIGASSAAMAHVDIGLNIGIPAPVYAAPAPVYAPPPVVYQPAPVYGAPVYGAPVYGGPAIVIGWHGDRYWDGRRYWGRDEWNRRRGPGRWDHGGGRWDHGNGRWH
ncbi:MULTISPECIES: hypothetical protein [Paraburkholderia]|uniref:PXPV repeat-containing protein n=1 Tax=Paraburkholderia megapolitana TaxID=420953 RepID=A0A1I3NG15_9BURK|nr:MULTISPECIES: hypothetical protein [Paraburkholderia]MCX4162131.1 hypothetical protein [Paraburkholderia megapolitana]MDN7157626.1 hypothetical protein [Paraburkholderia sp. CHISQ3]MDQ6494673.1 hypothetical protein [Paraburkholderia megapolitana]QDQ84352.1 hypothetical protein FNZ07_24975 [Paraburkholderia megapolitana]SFJ07890.1 hypothetical protein SAMN05192543_105358 [Paraburkholderia megapolitana]